MEMKKTKIKMETDQKAGKSYNERQQHNNSSLAQHSTHSLSLPSFLLFETLFLHFFNFMTFPN